MQASGNSTHKGGINNLGASSLGMKSDDYFLDKHCGIELTSWDSKAEKRLVIS